MAFTASITDKTVFGDKRIAFGVFTNTSGSAGGDIVTGLKRVENIYLTHSGSAVVASAPVVNETLPLNSGSVTIVTVADADGYWFAIGR